MIGAHKSVTEMTPAEYSAFMKKAKEEPPITKRKRCEVERFFSRPYPDLVAFKQANPAFYAAMAADLEAVNNGERPKNDRESRLKRFRNAFTDDIRKNATPDCVIAKAEKEGMIYESPAEIMEFYGILEKEIEADRKRGY